MRLWAVLLSFLLLSGVATELLAKKSGWGGSKRTKNYSSKKSVSRKSRGSSFDRARSLKMARDRSTSSHREYQAKREALEEKNSLKPNYSHQNSGYNGAVAGGVIGTGVAVASSTTPSNGGELEIEYEVHNHYYGDRTVEESRESSVEKVSSNSSGVPSIAIILIVILLLSGLYYLLSKRSRENRKKIKEKLPIDIRVGAIVDLTSIETRFIINRENYLFSKPETLKGYVTSIGEVILDEDMKIYNLYVSKEIDSKESIFYIKIEIYKNRISNIKLFTEYEEVNPSTVEEWEEWLDGTEDLYPLLGGIDFSTPDGRSYSRVWERGIDEVVRSKFIEKFSVDGEDSETLNMTTLYDKQFNNGEVEYLYLLNIEDSELNNFIRMDLGIEIDEGELQIL
jgi:hypothetical protein